MTLPIPLWAKILEHLPFSDVRSAMLLSRSIAFGATAQMEELSAMRVSDLNVAFMKKRTWNAVQVSIYLLSN